MCTVWELLLVMDLMMVMVKEDERDAKPIPFITGWEKKIV